MEAKEGFEVALSNRPGASASGRWALPGAVSLFCLCVVSKREQRDCDWAKTGFVFFSFVRGGVKGGVGSGEGGSGGGWEAQGRWESIVLFLKKITFHSKSDRYWALCIS